ncbi:hypothetical protein [Arthrobacter methylotrophus]
MVIGNDGIVLEGDGPDLDRIGPTLKALDANRIGTTWPCWSATTPCATA